MPTDATVHPVASADATAPELASPHPDAHAVALDGPTGTIVAREGTLLTVDFDGEVPLQPGQRAQLLRHFERRLGSATLSGWLDVARVTVIEQRGHALELAVDEETARVTINGRKQDQLREGFRVRLESPTA